MCSSKHYTNINVRLSMIKTNWFTKHFYRRKVTGIITNDRGEFLIDQLTDYGINDWNFPGGGIEKGETE